jgi:hypothetical protein
MNMCGKYIEGRNLQEGKSSCSIEILPASLKKESNKKKDFLAIPCHTVLLLPFP